MVGASKILTVSYGTFSCTLEGFDEPFSTMKAIAEYFRDLAADDRYFGAEPPTPDAEMLHKIAEREIHRRVEAKIKANGIVLRPEGAQDTLSGAVDDAPLLPNSSRDITVTGASDEELEARGIPARAAPLTQVTAAPTAQSATVQEMPLATEQVSAPISVAALGDAQVVETVAAKLQRIRAAVAQARAREASAPTFTEDQHADTYYRDTAPQDSAAIESDFGFELDISGPIEQDHDEPETTAAHALQQAQDVETNAPSVAEPALDMALDMADTPAPLAGASAAVREGRTFRIEPKVVKAPIVEPVPDAAQVDLDDADSAPEQAEARPEARVEHSPNWRAARRAARAEAAAKAQAEAEAEEAKREAQRAAAEARAEAEARRAADDARAAEEARLAAETARDAAAPQAEDEAAQAAPRIRARVIKVRRSDVEEAALGQTAPAVSATDLGASEQDSFDPTEESIKAVLAAAGTRAAPEPVQPAPVIAPAATAPAQAAPAQAALDDDAALLAAIGAQIDAPTASSLTHEAEDDLAAELADLERDWDEEDDLEEIAEVAPAASQAPEVQAEVTPEIKADLTADLDARQPSDSARALPRDEDEADVSRLMREANSKLEGAENRRRFSAIAHLKAAVAATVADRKVRETEGKPAQEEEVDTTGAYREDLTRAVRPRRPEPLGAATPRPSTPTPRAAPLVLVSEQRVDDSPLRVVAPVRPRRISTTDLSARIDTEIDEDEDDLPASAQEASDFAEFAERLGATGLADLLEAAAAFSEGIEGRPHFSRPQIIRKVAAITGQARYDREAGLRSFGTLLREGKIAKVKRGQFAITEQSRFYKEARRAGA